MTLTQQEMFSDLQFYQKHLVIFCLNLLFMYNLVTSKIKNIFFKSLTGLLYSSTTANKLDWIKLS